VRVFAVIGLFALWLALSASYHPAHIVVGLALSVLVVWLNQVGSRRTLRVSPLAAIAYLPWMLGRILKSGLHVSRLILHPSLPIAPRLIHHMTKITGHGELVVLGNSITLTPGTITVEVSPGELVEHAIDEASSEDLRSGTLENKVAGVFTATENTQ